jgi:S1-C subfamily serine protease
MRTRSHGNTANAVRWTVLIALIALAAYWSGARWGAREPVQVEAVGEQKETPKEAPSSSGLTEEEARTVKIYRQAAPAVANIITQAVEYDFFENAVPVEGAGSGFVIDPRGYVLTNNHVVVGSQNIQVTLGDRSRYTAKLVGADPRNDIALLKIDPKSKAIAALPLGDSAALQVGQSVLAIGNPFGFSSTLTKGVISALGRTVQTSDTTVIDQAIQTDAAINRGNSGGPLLNSHGEVIGINTAIYTPSGTTAGIGFATPINIAKRIAQDLITEGHVRRAFLGVSAIGLWPDLAQALKLPVDQGLLIERAVPGSPAAQAGIRGGDHAGLAGLQRLMIGGDIIVAIDGREVANNLDVNVVLNQKRPGDVIHLTLYRGNRKMDVTVALGEER